MTPKVTAEARGEISGYNLQETFNWIVAVFKIWKLALSKELPNARTCFPSQNFKKIAIKTVDSDVVITAVWAFSKFRIWHRRNHTIYADPWNSCSDWSYRCTSVFNFLCTQWLWHHIICFGKGKKNFLWNLETLAGNVSEVFARHLKIKSPKKVSENDFEDLEEFFTLLRSVATYIEIVNSALRVIKVVDRWKTLLPQQLHWNSIYCMLLSDLICALSAIGLAEGWKFICFCLNSSYWWIRCLERVYQIWLKKVTPWKVQLPLNYMHLCCRHSS